MGKDVKPGQRKKGQRGDWTVPMPVFYVVRDEKIKACRVGGLCHLRTSNIQVNI